MDKLSTIFTKAEEMKSELIEIRRHIHQNPELDMNTINTSKYVAELLKKMGYEPKFIGENGVTATVGKEGGKVFLLRADMDALPIQEESGLEYSSTVEKVSHCCGHDLHTAMLLGAAKLLKENEDSLKGMVKLLFQPGEENMKGAKNMLASGILENPKVDGACAVHVNASVKTGRVLVFNGPACASSDLFTIEIKGCGGHGSFPHKTIDPINVASHIHIALQELQSRELDPNTMGVLTIGCIKAGSTFNVIPNEAILMGTIRTYSNEIRNMLISRMKEITTHTAKAFRADVNVKMSENYTIPLVCDSKIGNMAMKAYANVLPKEDIQLMNKPFPGSEDFAFIADEVPSVFVVIGASIDKEVKYGQHHPKVIFNEDCLVIGATAYAQLASEWLENNN